MLEDAQKVQGVCMLPSARITSRMRPAKVYTMKQVTMAKMAWSMTIHSPHVSGLMTIAIWTLVAACT